MDKMGLGAPELGILCVVGIVALTIGVCFLLTLHRALSRVSPHNRLMEPGLVWLWFIPCFHLVWQFVVYTRVPDSLRNEFRERLQDDGSDYGKGIGLSMGVLNLVSTCSGYGARAAGAEAAVGSCVSGAVGLVTLVLFIMFWVKIANYSARLTQDGGAPRDLQRKLEHFDDDYDNRRRPPQSPEPPPPDTYKEGDPGRYQ